MSAPAPWTRPDPFARVNLGRLLGSAGDPDRIALVEDALSGPRTRWTAAMLDAEIEALAAGLLARGLVRGDRVGVLAANSARQVALYFGAMRAGLVIVPVNWKLPAQTVGYILADAGTALVFADAERMALVPPGADAIAIDGAAWDRFLVRGRTVEPVDPERDEIAQILYTSGSTGRPKGVPLSHAGQYWACAAVTRADNRHHRILVAAPMYHMNALFNLKFAFLNGATVILQRGFTADAFLAAIVEERATWLSGVPTMFALLAARVGDGPAPEAFAGVTRIFMGSSPFSNDLLARVKALFPNAVVTNGYGTTEAGPAVFGPMPDGSPPPDGSLGVAVPGSEVRIVGEDGRPLEGEAVGVLEMRNPATMSGYLNRPDKTAAALTPDGWYHSGDVVRRDAAGVLWFVGRADDMFVCGGENVWPAEVEKRLEAHPDVDQAVVVPIPDPVKQALPVAFVVPRAGARLTSEEVKRHAIATGPAYAHPRHVFLVEAIPLAGTNKIDRAALARDAAGRAGTAGRP